MRDRLEENSVKCRIPLPVREQRMIQDQVSLEWKKIQMRENRKMAERCLKIFLYVLARDYHFGKKRANEYYEKCGELLKQVDYDEVFWEHIDRVVIDQLEIKEFERDYTVNRKAVRDNE